MPSGPDSTSKVIARLRDGNLVRGFLDRPGGEDPTTFLERVAGTYPAEVTIRVAESDETLTIPLDSLKALFFVRSFEGHKEHREVKFFDKNPPIKGLWVRVQFFDKESLEGIIQNGIEFLVNPGFLLKPPDPAGNNTSLYVVKSSLADFRVLGIHTGH